MEGLAAVGFVDASVRFTHAAADGMHAAIIQASKPAQTSSDASPDTAVACCDTDEADACCEADAKAGCCGTAAGEALPVVCGCR
jgi:arsenite methyltransferase